MCVCVPFFALVAFFSLFLENSKLAETLHSICECDFIQSHFNFFEKETNLRRRRFVQKSHAISKYDVPIYANNAFVRSVHKFSFVLAVPKIIGCQLFSVSMACTLYVYLFVSNVSSTIFIAIDFIFNGVGHAVHWRIIWARILWTFQSLTTHWQNLWMEHTSARLTNE